MATLSDFTNPKQTVIFEKYKTFFAFGDKQYEQAAVKGVDYVHMGGNLFCPKQHYKQLSEDLETCHIEAIKEHKAEYSKDQIILSELYNHECFYTGEWKTVIEILEDYKYTDEEIETVYIDNIANS